MNEIKTYVLCFKLTIDFIYISNLPRLKTNVFFFLFFTENGTKINKKKPSNWIACVIRQFNHQMLLITKLMMEQRQRLQQKKKQAQIKFTLETYNKERNLKVNAIKTPNKSTETYFGKL